MRWRRSSTKHLMRKKSQFVPSLIMKVHLTISMRLSKEHWKESEETVWHPCLSTLLAILKWNKEPLTLVLLKCVKWCSQGEVLYTLDVEPRLKRIIYAINPEGGFKLHMSCRWHSHFGQDKSWRHSLWITTKWDYTYKWCRSVELYINPTEPTLIPLTKRIKLLNLRT